MSTLRLEWMRHPPEQFQGGAITIGNFDGVHLGHCGLVQTARKQAERLGGPTLAVTFDPPPLQLLAPDLVKVPVSRLSDRIDWLHQAGADHVVVLLTDAGLLSLSPEAFFEDVLLGLFRVQAVVEGYNFRFGRNRSGDTRTMAQLCQRHGIRFEEVPPRLFQGEPVSSSRIRHALTAGQIDLANELLGRPYGIHGTVIGGAQRGRTIGFPTANLDQVQTLIPKEGVYAVRAVTADGQRHAAAANVGPNPTFGEEARKIEVHLINFNADLYGQPLTVEFVRRLRDTQPFPDLDALRRQLSADIEQAKLFATV